MQDGLKKAYRVARELDQNNIFQSNIELKTLRRLSEMVINNHSEVNINFEFFRRELGMASIRGDYQTRLTLKCQRCLESFEVPVDGKFDLLIDASDAEVKAFNRDTVFSNEGYLDVFEIFEDELILSLPLVPLHQDPDCHKHWHKESVEPEPVKRSNPFEVLKSLKTGPDQTL